MSKLNQISLIILITIYGCANPDQWQSLFQGDSLEQWDTYLGPKYSISFPKGEIGKHPAQGLNRDTTNVFSIVELDGEKVIRVSGEIWGALISKEEYRNYHLQLQFKWGSLKWYPRNKETDKRDSGLLYHSRGEHVVDNGNLFWLTSQEYQIQETDVGDYWSVPNAICDIKSTLNEDSIYQFDLNGELRTFKKDSEFGRRCKKLFDVEMPYGEWNTIDLYCYEGASQHYLNGRLVMKIENSAYQKDEEIIELKKGKIQIQSEAAEIFFKNIKIRTIEHLPDL